MLFTMRTDLPIIFGNSMRIEEGDVKSVTNDFVTLKPISRDIILISLNAFLAVKTSVSSVTCVNTFSMNMRRKDHLVILVERQ